MKTYQDLLALGDNEHERGNFCRDAIREYMGTQEYRDAQDAEAYYHKHNITMERFQKFIYTVTGNRIPDLISANYKLKSQFFRRLVTQQVMFCLGNGLILSNTDSNGKTVKTPKDALGKDFDFQLKKVFASAMVSGKAFGFWNRDHLEPFFMVATNAHPGFCPLWDENNAEHLMGGIRFWYKRTKDKHLLNCTLYEEDGLTEFLQDDGGDMISGGKKAYMSDTVSNDIESETSYSNYGKLPIIVAFANDSHESELVGIRECIDCYDFIKSGLANQIDDSSGFYWLIKNAGGMGDKDLAQFIQRMKTVHAAVAKGDEVDAEAHTLDVPHEARSAMLEILRKDIYEDFQLLDITQLSAAQKTTQEIQAAYQSQENKCADFEYYILDFCQKILELAGIEADCSLNWNRIVNQIEQTNMILSAWNLIGDDMAIRKLPFLTPEEADQILEQRAADSLMRIQIPQDEEDDE